MAPSTSALPTHPQTGNSHTGTSHTPSHWHFPHTLTLALPTPSHGTSHTLALPTHTHTGTSHTPTHWHFPHPHTGTSHTLALALPTHPHTGTSHTPSHWHFPHTGTSHTLALPTPSHWHFPHTLTLALPTHPHNGTSHTPSHWHFPHTLTLALPTHPHTGHLPHSLTSSYLVGGIGEVAEQLGAVRWGVGDGVPLQVELLQAGQWGEILHLCYLRRDVCHYWCSITLKRGIIEAKCSHATCLECLLPSYTHLSSWCNLPFPHLRDVVIAEIQKLQREGLLHTCIRIQPSAILLHVLR